MMLHCHMRSTVAAAGVPRWLPRAPTKCAGLSAPGLCAASGGGRLDQRVIDAIAEAAMTVLDDYRALLAAGALEADAAQAEEAAKLDQLVQDLRHWRPKRGGLPGLFE